VTRILFISRCPPYPLYLGDRLIVHHLAEELEGHRHQLDLLAFANRPDDWHEQDQYDMRFKQVELIAEPERSQLSYLQRILFPPARWPRRAEDSWSPDMWRAIERQLATNQYDVVHLFGGIQVYEFYHALKGLPTLITPYESYSLYLRRQREASSGLMEKGITQLRLMVTRRFESWMFMPYRQTVVVSQKDKDELLGLNPALAITVIPNGIDLYTFRRRQVKHKARALLFVGNFEYAPNVDAALRLINAILPAVQQQIPDIRLWLVGNAPPPELLALQNKSVVITGRVPDVRPYLARALAFVSPLRLGAGIKNKVLEALAIGCPVVATPLSVDGIDVRHGYDALIADGDLLVESIVRLVNDAALQHQLAENGRRLIESHYSWDQVVSRYEQLYEEIQHE
jgi:glycosyltransferase involved in cell wall biosynthesis